MRDREIGREGGGGVGEGSVGDALVKINISSAERRQGKSH